MNLIISYNLLYHNWYVGEFYKLFFEHLETIETINVEYIHLNQLSEKYGINHDYNNGLPSICSPYNLLIINKDNNKTFVHSFHDYAPAMLSKGSGIEHFDIVKFACVPRLDQGIIDSNKGIVIQPSVYLLENWDEHNFIEQNRNNNKTNDKVFFNGLCYGVRQRYKEVLDKSSFFDFKKKDSPDYKQKEAYYKQLSEYKYGLNLDGAAKICYRDLEYFGMGTLLLREKLNVLTYEPIIPDIHYIELFDEEIINNINSFGKEEYIISKLENNLMKIFEDKEKINKIVDNARGWYERNCLPENQIKIVLSFLENFTIFR